MGDFSGRLGNRFNPVRQCSSAAAIIPSTKILIGSDHFLPHTLHRGVIPQIRYPFVTAKQRGASARSHVRFGSIGDEPNLLVGVR